VRMNVDWGKVHAGSRDTDDPWPMLATTDGGRTWQTIPADTSWGRISGVDYRTNEGES